MSLKFKNKNKNMAVILFHQQMHLIEQIWLFITTTPTANPKCKESGKLPLSQFKRIHFHLLGKKRSNILSKKVKTCENYMLR